MRKISCMLIAFATMTATGIWADNSVAVTEILCEKLPFPCNILCQDAKLAEYNAIALEKDAIEARANADSANNTALFFEDIAARKAYQIKISGEDIHWYEKNNPFLQSLTSILWSQIVPREVMRDYKITKNSSVQYPPRGVKKKEAAEALTRAKEARDKANAEAKAAFVADSTSSAARKAADKAHSLYEECLCW